MKTNVIFQSVKREGGENFLVFKTDKEFKHTDENGVTTKANYITKSALTLLKDCDIESVASEVFITLNKNINKDCAECTALLARAGKAIRSFDVAETEVKANVIYNGNQHPFDWVHHEITNIVETNVSDRFWRSLEADKKDFKEWMSENSL